MATKWLVGASGETAGDAAGSLVIAALTTPTNDSANAMALNNLMTANVCKELRITILRSRGWANNLP
jgi:hypothetical protein